VHSCPLFVCCLFRSGNHKRLKLLGSGYHTRVKVLRSGNNDRPRSFGSDTMFGATPRRGLEPCFVPDPGAGLATMFVPNLSLVRLAILCKCTMDQNTFHCRLAQ
jgi:hypothetical protein